MRRVLLLAAAFSLVAGIAVAQTPTDPATELNAAKADMQSALAHINAALAAMSSTTAPSLPPTTTAPATTAVTTSPPAPPVATVLQGSCPDSFTWDQAHGGCASARTTSGSGLLTFRNIREDAWEDGWKPRETPFGSGTATMLVENVYATRIHDDGIEDDNFIPGTIRDSLYDGIHTFLSEQCEGSGTCTTTTISPGENPNINITNVLVRLRTPNADKTRQGQWFKWQGRGMPNHHPVITDSVFAMTAQPNAGWSTGASFKGAEFHGTNYILWLGTPGTYGGARPAGVTFLEGAQAQNAWCTMRAAWLSNHGYPVTACSTAL